MTDQGIQPGVQEIGLATTASREDAGVGFILSTQRRRLMNIQGWQGLQDAVLRIAPGLLGVQGVFPGAPFLRF